MKLILPILLVLFLGNAAFAQTSFSVNKAQFTESGAVGTAINTTVEVTNTSANPITLKLRQRTPNLLSGHRLQVCWADLCLFDAPSTDEVTINPGETYLGWKVDLQTTASAAEGVSTVSYAVYLASGGKDSAVVSFSFNVSKTSSASSNISVKMASLANAFPNPADETVNINCQLPDRATNARIVIYDMMGKEAMRQPISGGSNALTFNVKALKPGIYFYSLEANEKIVATKRLIITH